MANLKAVIYARYSSSSQREESIEGQIHECTTFAQRNGYTVIGTYADSLWHNGQPSRLPKDD